MERGRGLVITVVQIYTVYNWSRVTIKKNYKGLGTTEKEKKQEETQTDFNTVPESLDT